MRSRRMTRQVSALIIIGCGVALGLSSCALSDASARADAPANHMPTAVAPARPQLAAASQPSPRPRRLDDRPHPSASVARAAIALRLNRVPLGDALLQLAQVAGLELVADSGALNKFELTLAAESLNLGELLSHLEASFPIQIECAGKLLRVSVGGGARLALLIYPLPGGLILAPTPQDFDSLRQLSFISRSQQVGSGDAAFTAPAPTPEPLSHIEQFLARLPELFPGSTPASWHLDRQRNVLVVRAEPHVLDQLEACLATICAAPFQVEIETRFLEVSEDHVRDLGVELGLLGDFPLDRRHGDSNVVLAQPSATAFGVEPAAPGVATGATLSVLGLLTQPRFSALLRAFESTGAGEVLSAPAVTAVNNTRATIAITTNLPFVEDYRPVFNRSLVATDGISSTESEVALVATINDENFTGIVLNVTPSIAADGATIQLRLQPVVRDQVDSIQISNGALIEGTTVPAISRPIIETRFIDTQLSIPNGATVVLGGLKTTTESKRTARVPFIGAIPLLGRLFSREVIERERRDLLVCVTARVCWE
ncbi:MAG: type II secretion system protein GspD [Planctomycetota bacterium]